MQHIDIYTDGSFNPETKSGGYSYILVYEDKDGTVYEKDGSGSYRNSSNNRMEITAIIYALKELNYKCSVTIHSDSRFICNMFTEHIIDKWKDCNYRRNGRRLKNEQLWKNLLIEVAKHDVSFKWIKAHDGNEYNERCDLLAKQAVRELDEKLCVNRKERKAYI